jgi:hypothetical protein
MANTSLTLLERSDGHLVGSFDDIFVSIWWAPADVAQLLALAEYQEEMARDYPAGYGSLTILGAGAGKVSAEVRAEAERVSRRGSLHIRANAQVIEGTGFGAAAVRSVAMAIMALSGSRAPFKMFDSLSPAAGWLTLKLGKPKLAAPLVNAVLDARTRAKVA